ncbi:hypothetical protein ACU6QD_05090 [Corynebacterium glucuronolyticum]
MSAFANGIAATVTVAALTTGLCTSASAQTQPDATFKTTYKNGTCTIEVIVGQKPPINLPLDDEDDLKNNLEGTIGGFKDYQKKLAEAKQKLARLKKDKNTPDYELQYVQDDIDYATSMLPYLAKQRAAIQACLDKKSASAAEIDAQALLSSIDGKGLSPAGIGVTMAGIAVAALGLIVAALPQIKPLLPQQIATLLP